MWLNTLEDDKEQWLAYDGCANCSQCLDSILYKFQTLRQDLSDRYYASKDKPTKGKASKQIMAGLHYLSVGQTPEALASFEMADRIADDLKDKDKERIQSISAELHNFANIAPTVQSVVTDVLGPNGLAECHDCAKQPDIIANTRRLAQAYKIDI